MERSAGPAYAPDRAAAAPWSRQPARPNRDRSTRTDLHPAHKSVPLYRPTNDTASKRQSPRADPFVHSRADPAQLRDSPHPPTPRFGDARNTTTPESHA